MPSPAPSAIGKYGGNSRENPKRRGNETTFDGPTSIILMAGILRDCSSARRSVTPPNLWSCFCGSEAAAARRVADWLIHDERRRGQAAVDTATIGLNVDPSCL